MACYDFIQIFFVHVGIPGFFRVNHHDRAFFTSVETAGLIDTYLTRAMYAQFLAAFFHIGARLAGAKILATGSAVGALITADEYMIFEYRHDGFQQIEYAKTEP